LLPQVYWLCAAFLLLFAVLVSLLDAEAVVPPPTTNPPPPPLPRARPGGEKGKKKVTHLSFAKTAAGWAFNSAVTVSVGAAYPRA